MKKEIINHFHGKINSVEFKSDFIYHCTSELLNTVEEKFGECYNDKFIEDFRDAFIRIVNDEGSINFDEVMKDIDDQVDEANLFEEVEFYKSNGIDHFEYITYKLRESVYTKEISEKASFNDCKDEVILDLIRDDGYRVEASFKVMMDYLSQSVEYYPCEDFLTYQESDYYQELDDKSKEVYDYAVTSEEVKRALKMTVLEFYNTYNNPLLLNKLLNKKLTGIKNENLKPDFIKVGKVIFGDDFKGISEEHPFVGGIQRFENLTLEKYNKLVSLGALKDRYKSFNYAPSSNELSEIVEKEPNNLRLAGYMNSDKNDSQVYINAIHSRVSINDLAYYGTKKDIEGLKKLADRYETDPIYVFFD